LDLSTASCIVKKHLDVVHPYGDLGALHDADANVSFGQEQTPETYAAGDAIYAMSQRLLTFTESKKAQAERAKAFIAQARHLVFLGFGFGDQNVDLLRVPSSNIARVRATTKTYRTATATRFFSAFSK
jgi:hypothetical protein